VGEGSGKGLDRWVVRISPEKSGKKMGTDMAGGVGAQSAVALGATP
jgi:hypothetical protein